MSSNLSNTSAGATADAEFYKQVTGLLAVARGFAKRQLDSVIVADHYEIGRRIVEREQQGRKRAQCGAKLLHREVYEK
ncbi:MAG: hypothetical protein LBS59_07180 [Puniceicoccales bacterium]|jgi:hypothetical protein|nr:hypothetical protein [Puniceicoccales bacterium]